MLLVTLLHLFDFTFKIISIFMYRTCFSCTFRGYNDHISINLSLDGVVGYESNYEDTMPITCLKYFLGCDRFVCK